MQPPDPRLQAVTRSELRCLPGESRKIGFENRIQQIGLVDAGSAEGLADGQLLQARGHDVIRGHARHRTEVEPLAFVKLLCDDARAKRLHPQAWDFILRSWVSGEDIAKVGPQNMRAVEDAFTYRLAWALEAVRTRFRSLSWSPETVAGRGSAAVETGIPQFMMSMLIRAGLPSNRAAMAAIEDAKPGFVTPAEMRA